MAHGHPPDRVAFQLTAAATRHLCHLSPLPPVTSTTRRLCHTLYRISLSIWTEFKSCFLPPPRTHELADLEFPGRGNADRCFTQWNGERHGHATWPPEARGGEWARGQCTKRTRIGDSRSVLLDVRSWVRCKCHKYLL